ncbi:hypothetical protein HHI36_021160 [Cryptolaemus montrouzieri]|uniref:acid phosphatase n=1 Tax=Cryptolaemus montrouzieri TaxID=559131 RepID=A0ABD2MWX8_9CUCU
MLIAGVLIWVACLSLCDFVRGDDTLIAVSLLYRHGDRTIAQSYPTDPYQNESFWPVPYGELTNTGKTQHYELGQWLRQHYNSFLSQKYLAKEFVLQSSNYDRCLMSAGSNLAGLYPPQGDQVWNPSLPWQPIPIHTKPKLNDGMLALAEPCPTFDKLADELMDTEQYQTYENDNKELYAYLSENTGSKIDSFSKANDLYDTLLIESMNNYTLPEWTNSVFPDKLEPVALTSFEFETHTPEMAKFRVGQVFDQILKQFDSFVSSSSDVSKFQVFSAHDTNVFNILNSLRIPNLQLVPYCGMVIFELRKTSEGKYFVQFLYKQDKEPDLLTIQGCTSNCDYDNFKAIMQPLSLSEQQWEDACNAKSSKK